MRQFVSLILSLIFALSGSAFASDTSAIKEACHAAHIEAVTLDTYKNGFLLGLTGVAAVSPVFAKITNSDKLMLFSFALAAGSLASIKSRHAQADRLRLRLLIAQALGEAHAGTPGFYTTALTETLNQFLGGQNNFVVGGNWKGGIYRVDQTEARRRRLASAIGGATIEPSRMFEVMTYLDQQNALCKEDGAPVSLRQIEASLIEAFSATQRP